MENACGSRSVLGFVGWPGKHGKRQSHVTWGLSRIEGVYLQEQKKNHSGEELGTEYG